MLAWELLAEGEDCDAEALAIHPRQVDYYLSALRILGVIDGSGSNAVPPVEPWSKLKTRFERSACGTAWLHWCGVDSIERVDPETARAFLEARSQLTGSTIVRRAATLERWHQWLTSPTPPPLRENNANYDERDHVDDMDTDQLGHFVPGLVTVSDWRTWKYNDWNDRLVDHCFWTEDPLVGESPLDRIAATPDELALIAQAAAADASEVASRFVQTVVEQQPVGRRSFCGFCREYGGWNSNSPDAPHFFGMLWFTCLIAYGYPNGDGGFFPRLWDVLGKSENFQTGGKACLPKLWHDIEEWTRARRRAGDSIRQLELPPRSDHRPVIGYSHFLAFPNRVDRNALAAVLWQNDLVGFEPPIVPVLDAIQRAAREFSADFREDFEGFVRAYTAGVDPRDSAFWRAVRREALEPSFDPNSEPRSPKSGLVFFEEDDGLHPVVVCAPGHVAPDGFEEHDFDQPGAWPRYLTGPDHDLEAASREAFEEGRVLSLGLRRLVAQGVLVLKQSASGEYAVAQGSDIQGCDRALVADHLVTPFLGAFGIPTTRTELSLVRGWTDVVGCEVLQLDTLPTDLANVTQLLRTMNPPSVAFAGGIRTSGRFLFVPEFLPVVRAWGVEGIELILGAAVHACAPDATKREWRLPGGLDFTKASTKIRATWTVARPNGAIERNSETQIRFAEHVVVDTFNGPPSGHHYVESCPDPEAEAGGGDQVLLGITTTSPELSSDLLEMDSSARFLGPGVGEMAYERRPGFDWLVLGAKKKPELLIYVGDPEAPTPPAARCSPSKGDQRHWRHALGSSRRTLVRTKAGQYVNIDSATPRVLEALETLRKHRATDSSQVAATRLETITPTAVAPPLTDPRTASAMDILGALASRRAGLRYPTVREVFQALMRNDDPITFQQVLRGWVEAGVLDSLRDARTSRLSLVPRAPRFVMVRRGPEVEATLIGLVTSVRQVRVREAISDTGVDDVREIPAANPWQPGTIRIRCSVDQVERVRVRSELRPSEWLEWPNEGLPACLDIGAARRRLMRTRPPDSYRFDQGWDWERATFYRGHRSNRPVRLERRRHRDGSSIFVVTRDGHPIEWTHIRAWSLLEAYSALGVPPFSVQRGIVASAGVSPAHLPLPVGRLCVIIGDGLPGPSFQAESIRYSYPFGRRLFDVVERVLPPEWITAA